MKHLFNKKTILNVLKVVIGIIILGALLYGSVQIYEVQTHALKREEYFNKLFALSLLVPRGFEIYQEGGMMIIENEDYQVLIIRRIHKEDYIESSAGKLYDKNAGRRGTGTEVSTSTLLSMKYEEYKNKEEELKKLEKDQDALIKALGFERIVVDGQDTLDGKEIYFGNQNCYHTLDKENDYLFDEMELFTSTNKHNSVRVCITGKRSVGAEKRREYDDMTDKIVMSMEDLLPRIERGRKAYEELHGKEEE